jgi:DNA-binding NtrC family response regulator
VARAIHRRSPRRDRPFVAVNCSAIPRELMESEFFGHEKGSFTGATARRVGRFEQAEGSTLFLDEVGELDPSLQAKLLRVLQEREFTRIGAAAPTRADVRIVAASNRDLAALVQEGRFRDDLFYRLNVIPLRLPPLRERSGDLPDLMQHFLASFAGRYGKGAPPVPPDIAEAARAYPWPGNVRELRNVLERGAVVAAGDVVKLADLGLPAPAGKAPAAAGPATLEDVERRHIADVLGHASGNVSQAARLLGIDRVTLYNKIRKYQLRRDGEDADSAAS